VAYRHTSSTLWLDRPSVYHADLNFDGGKFPLDNKKIDVGKLALDSWRRDAMSLVRKISILAAWILI
jgi:hypothetical protein